MTPAQALAAVEIEVSRACAKHKPMNSPHEAYAVLLEEVDELWEEIKHDRGRQESARDEAIQVAAMAIRYLVDLTETKGAAS